MADHRYHSPLDRFVAGADKALRVVAGVAAASRPTPAARAADAVLSEAEQRHSAGLMRVNHVGEVCAQALYNAQSRFAKSDAMRAQFEQAGREEEDHLAWTAQRLAELGSHTSVLNPLFYAGAYALGTVAAIWATPAAWALWWKPNARSRPIWPATSTSCRRRTPSRAPSSSRCGSTKIGRASC